jgi:hypothetical protein
MMDIHRYVRKMSKSLHWIGIQTSQKISNVFDNNSKGHESNARAILYDIATNRYCNYVVTT